MRTLRLLVVIMIAALMISACGTSEEAAPGAGTTTNAASNQTPDDSPGGSADDSPGGSAAETESPDRSESPREPTEPEGKGVVVDITVAGDEITPNGLRIEAEVGEPVILTVQADRSGELHVHATPEQEIAFDPGTTQHEIVIEQPGVVEVEEHESGFVILQLQVS